MSNPENRSPVNVNGVEVDPKLLDMFSELAAAFSGSTSNVEQQEDAQGVPLFRNKTVTEHGVFVDVYDDKYSAYFHVPVDDLDAGDRRKFEAWSATVSSRDESENDGDSLVRQRVVSDIPGSKETAMGPDDVDKLRRRIHREDTHAESLRAAKLAQDFGISPEAARRMILSQNGVDESSTVGVASAGVIGEKSSKEYEFSELEISRSRIEERSGGRGRIAIRAGGLGLLLAGVGAISVWAVDELKGAENEELSAALDPAAVSSLEERISLDIDAAIGWPYEDENGETKILMPEVGGESVQMSMRSRARMIVNEIDEGAISVTEGVNRIAKVDLSKLEVGLVVYPGEGKVSFDEVDFANIEAEGLTEEVAIELASRQGDAEVIGRTQEEVLLFANYELYRQANYRQVVVESLQDSIANSLNAQAEMLGVDFEVKFSGEPVFMEPVDVNPSLLNEMSHSEAIVEAIQSKSPDVEVVLDKLKISNLEMVTSDDSSEESSEAEE